MTDREMKRAHKTYVARWGTLHPERSITLDQFRERFAAFESVIDPWITGEGSREGAIRKFAKLLGMKTYVGRSVFAALFDVVDAIHPAS